MEKHLLVGNGINIQFGGFDNYSNSAIIKRVIKNIKAGKYNELTENSLMPEEQLGLLDGLVNIIDSIKSGGYAKYADGLFMLMELERVKRTYPEKSIIESVFMEDYFLAFEIFNNSYKEKDGEEISESHRKIMFDFLHRILVDGIYNDGKINDVYKKAYSGMKKYFYSFSGIFTTNYDYNIENIMGESSTVCHLHGEFNRLSPRYDVGSKYYKAHQTECDELIAKKVSGMNHVYSDTIMSWSWLDKYGELIEPDTKAKETLFKSISGQLVLLGLSPNNDEHLFFLLNQNPNIKSVTYYYCKDADIQEIPHHIKKPVTFKKVDKLWNSMK
ncbi:MAG: hypothetical protein WBP82_05225 [Leuconostoc mesenteroides]